MDQYELIRTAHRVYGKSIREIGRETGHHRETIRKALAGKEPKYRRRKPTRCPVMDPVTPIIEGWLLGDRDRPRRQRPAEIPASEIPPMICLSLPAVIPSEAGRVSSAYSGPNRPLIPIESGHLFRGNPAGDSGAK